MTRTQELAFNATPWLIHYRQAPIGIATTAGWKFGERKLVRTEAAAEYRVVSHEPDRVAWKLVASTPTRLAPPKAGADAGVVRIEQTAIAIGGVCIRSVRVNQTVTAALSQLSERSVPFELGGFVHVSSIEVAGDLPGSSPAALAVTR